MSDFQQDQSPDQSFFMKYADPFSAQAIQNGVNPGERIKNVQVEFKDDQVNEAYKRYILGDFASLTSINQINSKLTDFYKKLQKTSIYKKIEVSFEPGNEVDSIKVVFTPERKRRISGSFDQQIAKDGSYVQEGKLMVKNIFGLLDNLSIELSKGWGGNLPENYHIKYTLPIFYKDYSLDLSFEKSYRDLVPTVREESSGHSMTIFNDEMYYRFSNNHKLNFIDLIKHSKQTLDQEIFPLRRYSFKVGRVWNNIYEIGKEYGSRTELSGELAGGKGGSPLCKLEFNKHSFFNPRSLEYEKKWKHINIEHYFNAGLTIPLSRTRLRMNDRFYTHNVRGFAEVGNVDHLYDRALHPLTGTQGYEKLGEYVGDDAYIKNTFKVNFNHYPYLRQGGLVPFVYYSVAYMSGNIMNRRHNHNINLLQEINHNTRHSVGVGLQKSFGAAKLEILLNMFNKGKITDRFARFQLRISVND